MSYDYAFKYIIVGDAAVGKSSIMKRYTDDVFQYDNVSTIGVDFSTKNLLIENKNIQIQIWDTAGQERFRSIIRQYYKNTIVSFLVFDITRRNTYFHIQRWLDEMIKYVEPYAIIVLIGNKCDNEIHREVSYEEASSYAKLNNMVYVETSAKTETHINDVFLSTAKKVYTLIMNGTISLGNIDSGVKIGDHIILPKHIIKKSHDSKCNCK